MFKLNLKNTFIYTVLGFLPLSFSLIFTPFYTQYLSKSDYGLLNLFNIISGIMVPFLGLGIDQAAGFLYWDYSKNKKDLAAFMSTTICLICIIALVILSAGFLLGPWFIRTFVKDAVHFTLWPYLSLCLIYPFFMTLSRILLYYYRNEGNIKKYAFLNVSTLLLVTAGSVLGVIIFEKGSEGAVEGRTIGFCAIVFLFILFELKKTGLLFRKKIALPMIKMGGPLFISTLIGSLAYVGDRLIVEEFGTLEMLGIYGFSVTIASVVEILMAALGNSFTPGIYKTILEENENDYKNTHFQLFLYVYILIGATVFVTAIIAPFMKLFISPNFFESVKYIPLLCLAFIPRIFTQLYSLKFYKKKKTRFIFWLNAAYFVSVLFFGIVFYKLWSLTGAALAVFLTGLVNMFAVYRLSKKIDNFLFQFNKLYLLFALISASILLLSVLPLSGIYVYLGYLFPSLLFIFSSLIFLKKECGDIKQHLWVAWQKLRKQNKSDLTNT